MHNESFTIGKLAYICIVSSVNLCSKQVTLSHINLSWATTLLETCKLSQCLKRRFSNSDPICKNKRDTLTRDISISIRDLVHSDWQWSLLSKLFYSLPCDVIPGGIGLPFCVVIILLKQYYNHYSTILSKHFRPIYDIYEK